MVSNIHKNYDKSSVRSFNPPIIYMIIAVARFSFSLLEARNAAAVCER